MLGLCIFAKSADAVYLCLCPCAFCCNVFFIIHCWPDEFSDFKYFGKYIFIYEVSCFINIALLQTISTRHSQTVEIRHDLANQKRKAQIIDSAIPFLIITMHLLPKDFLKYISYWYFCRISTADYESRSRVSSVSFIATKDRIFPPNSIWIKGRTSITRRTYNFSFVVRSANTYNMHRFLPVNLCTISSKFPWTNHLMSSLMHLFRIGDCMSQYSSGTYEKDTCSRWKQ